MLLSSVISVFFYIEQIKVSNNNFDINSLKYLVSHCVPISSGSSGLSMFFEYNSFGELIGMNQNHLIEYSNRAYAKNDLNNNILTATYEELDNIENLIFNINDSDIKKLNKYLFYVILCSSSLFIFSIIPLIPNNYLE